MRRSRIRQHYALIAALLAVSGCDTPHTSVIVENRYSTSEPTPFVVYKAHWLATRFEDPLLPGEVSAEQTSFSASPNTAYALIAPGWDPAAGAPTSFLLLQSRGDFALSFNDTLRIPIDDAHFTGNCAVRSRLTQEQAEFIAQQVFPSDLSSFKYDALTCKTSINPADGGAD